MSSAQIENSVKANARKLDKKIPSLKQHTGKYVAFNGSELLVHDSFSTAIEEGGKKFGENSGFVVRKIGYTPILSHLVKK